jgi:predicted transposase/invertase (TIGR01784 family)
MEMHDTHNIFDKAFKRLILSSKRAVIHLINGLFDAGHPLDSSVEYPNTEFVTGQMKHLYSDILIVIGGIHRYHLEAQIQHDSTMALRIFEYGFQYALRNKTMHKGLPTVSMPRACVIYLTPGAKKTKQSAFRLLFPDGSSHIYRVKAFYLLNHEIRELEDRKMVILLPFYILKLKKAVERAGNREKLRELSQEAVGMMDEILKAVERSGRDGILSAEESGMLIELLKRLYNEVYRNYDEFKEADMRLQDIIMTMSEEAEVYIAEVAEIRSEEHIREVVRNMKKIGISAEQIAQVTGFSVEELEGLPQSRLEERIREVARNMKKAGFYAKWTSRVTGLPIEEFEEL